MASQKLSGFPEWLPAQRIVEQHVLQTLQRVFELHGFASLESRAVEPVSELLKKGETSKEIYLLRRLQQDPVEAANDPKQLGLHFDLTVPLARYVVANAGNLHFPYKRYQMQKVWRGERPQDGRFREFTQADIDIVGDGTLAFHHEVEVANVMLEVFSALELDVVISVNNRKVVQGFCEGIGVQDVEAALRSLDKLDKIGAAGVREAMAADGFNAEQIDALIELAGINGGIEVIEKVRALGVENELLEEGLGELAALVEADLGRGLLKADLKIARGLDYYTGSVYETTLVGHADLGSICSGGRYDSLAQSGKKTYPGVGLSIGVSRLVSRLLGEGGWSASRQVPTCVLVAVTNEEERGAAQAVARKLRSRGISADVAPSAAKFGKQIRYADRRGIPYVWFTDSGEVKDIRSGEQVAADADTFMPPSVDLQPQIIRADRETP